MGDTKGDRKITEGSMILGQKIKEELDNRSIKKILIIAIRAIGDMVLITPVIESIKNSYPHIELSLLIDSSCIAVFKNNPKIDRLYLIDRERSVPLLKKIKENRSLFRHLRGCDIAIDLFSRGPRGALISFLSGAPYRVGDVSRGGVKNICYNLRLRVPQDKHLVEQKLWMMKSIGIENIITKLKLYISEEEKEFAKEFFLSKGLIPGKDLLVGLFPGSGWINRNWPPERFAMLGDILQDKFDSRVILFGGERDRDVVEGVAELMRRKPFVFESAPSLRNSILFMNECDIFVSNDTGPMHIAVALGIPTVCLYGPGDRTLYGPWGNNALVVCKGLDCSPCPPFNDYCKDNKCMKLIEVDEVLEEINHLLRKELIADKDGISFK